jgi:hypothetical protein
MKLLLRALALVAVLGFVCLPASSSGPGSCRYHCGATIYETVPDSPCCSSTFTCPDGRQVNAYGYYSATGWRFCL